MKLIDSDKLEEKIEEINSIDYGSMDSFEAHDAVSDCLRDIVRIIDYQPMVDSVPVVRCEDCKYANHGKLHQKNFICNRFKTGEFTHIIKPDDFCSYGIRKDADTHETD